MRHPKKVEDASELERGDSAAARQRIWTKLLEDTDARSALKQLEEDGFAIAHLTPSDPTFRYPSWVDYITAIPFVSHRQSHRRIHRKTTLQKYSPLVAELRHFAQKVNDPFCEVSISSEADFSTDELTRLGARLLETAEFIERFLSWVWYTRDRNQRNALIAALRWQIRWRTGKPHDSELATLIDAAFRAAGVEEGLYVDPTALDRMEKREKEGRVKAASRLRALVNGTSVLGKPLRQSTRFRKIARKRV